MSLTLQEKVDAMDLEIGQPLTDDMFTDREREYLTSLVDDLAYRRAVRARQPALLIHGRLAQTEAARCLGVVRGTVQNWLRSGRLRTRTVFFESDYCIDGAHVDELIRWQVADADQLGPSLLYAWKRFVAEPTDQNAIAWQSERLKNRFAKGLRRRWERFSPATTDAASKEKR